ncbi:MAG: TorD/DmsD family molecular chaperone [Desulfosalsimonas sp.]
MEVDSPSISKISKADVFAVLAACYAEPGPGLAGMLGRLCADSSFSGRIFPPEINELKELFEKTDIHDLRLDHARLFIGPFELAAAPFGSVYLDGGRTLMGESTSNIRDLYRQAGLEMAENFNNPPDHIIAELEFAAYLVSAESGPETAENIKELKLRFFRDHLGAWIEPFTRAVEQGAATGFYQLLGRLTRKIVLGEAGSV